MTLIFSLFPVFLNTFTEVNKKVQAVFYHLKKKKQIQNPLYKTEKPHFTDPTSQKKIIFEYNFFFNKTELFRLQKIKLQLIQHKVESAHGLRIIFLFSFHSFEQHSPLSDELTSCKGFWVQTDQH